MEKNSDKPVTYSYLLAAFTFLLWGTSFTAGKFISPDPRFPISPITITFYRTVLGALTIFIIILYQGRFRSWVKVFKQYFFHYFVIGVILYAFAFIAEYWALNRTESSNQAALSNTMVFWVVLINTFIFRQKPTKTFLVGLAIAITGVFLILISDDFTFSNSTLPGDLGTLGAYLLWGGYSAFTAKINEKTDPLFTTLSIFLTSLLVLLPLSLFTGELENIQTYKLENWIAFLYLGIFCGGIAFWTYNLALSNKRISSEYIVLFSLLNPIIGTISGLLLLEEILYIRELIGIILILSAIVISNRNPKSRNSEELEQNIKNDKIAMNNAIIS